HEHIERCLEGQGVSTNVRRLISSLLKNNYIRIHIGDCRSEAIQVKRSVPQGGPLSPLLFNVAIDRLYREMCDRKFSGQNGYQLYPDLDSLSLLGFADDQLAVSSTLEGVTRTVALTKQRFQEIGLDVNPEKSTAIAV